VRTPASFSSAAVDCSKDFLANSVVSTAIACAPLDTTSMAFTAASALSLENFWTESNCCIMIITSAWRRPLR
jgi:hypothetical protein